MREKIFLTTFDESSRRSLIIEEDDYSLWAYLTRPDVNDVDFAGFICAVSDPVYEIEDFSIYMKNGSAPPILKELTNEFTYKPEVSANDLSISFNEEERNVTVDLQGRLYLVMDYIERRSFSKGINEESPYGFPLEDGTNNK